MPSTPIRLIAVLVLLFFALQASARIEVIDLKHRPATALVPLLQPLVGDDVILRPDGYRLIVRGNEAAIDTIREALTRLDTKIHSLRISLRQISTDSDTAHAVGGGGGVVLGTDGDVAASAQARIRSTRTRDQGQLIQSVRALEGEPVFIDTGSSVPIHERAFVIGRNATGTAERTRYLNLPQGFYATARLHGDQVSIAISVDNATWKSEQSPIERRSVVTRVQGRIGEWIPFGSSLRTGRLAGSGITRSTRNEQDRQERFELRVQALD